MMPAIMLGAGLIGLTLPQPNPQNLGTHGLATAVASAPSQHRATISAATQTSASLVYVADAVNNAIYVYKNVSNATPIYAITGLSNPHGIAVDSYGNLYVANGGANNVLVYAPGSGTPSHSYSQGLSAPSDVAVSSSGAVYVTNSLGGNVVVYQPGSPTPSTIWQSPIANSALVGIALQSPAGGNVYVSYESPSGSGVLQCAVGSSACSGTGLSVAAPFALAFQYNTSPLNLLVSDLSSNVIDVFHLRHGTSAAAQFRTPGSPNGLAFDPGYGHIFVANESSTGGVVNEYHYPSGALDKSFLPPKTALRPFFAGVAVYPSTVGPPTLTANLFIEDRFTDSISTFSTAAGIVPLRSITGGGLNSPAGTALSPSGKLFVTNPLANSVSVFDTTNGNVLLGTITGGGLNGPSGAALDSAGNLYVANTLGNSLSVFSAANGYAPAALVTGNGLNIPSGIAIDQAMGVLYVANAGNNSLDVFEGTLTGYYPITTAPGFVLTDVGLNVPQGVAVSSDGSVYVANSGDGSVSVFTRSLLREPSITGGGLNLPEGVAVDASGKLYVTNFGANSVTIFDTVHGNKLLTTITGGTLNGPEGVAVR